MDYKNKIHETPCDDFNESKNVDNLPNKYVYAVRNLKLLTKENINDIRTMTNNDKMEIIVALNDVVECLLSVQ